MFVCAALLLMTGCKVKKSSTINYQRRLAQYLPSDNKNTNNVGGFIDLSEGPKLQYEGHLGPKDLDFDVKIKNPY